MAPHPHLLPKSDSTSDDLDLDLARFGAGVVEVWAAARCAIIEPPPSEPPPAATSGFHRLRDSAYPSLDGARAFATRTDMRRVIDMMSVVLVELEIAA